MRLFVVVLAVLGLALSATTASAATKEVTVDGELIFANANRPGDPGNCSAVIFGKWRDVPRTVSATFYYLWKGSETSKTKAPPFDDVYEWVATYTVEPGSHWIAISTGWADGPGVNDCSDFHERSKDYFDRQPLRVELTVEIDPAECKAAQKALKKRQKAVSNLRAQLRKAETAKAKRKLNGKPDRAKLKRGKAAKRSAPFAEPARRAVSNRFALTGGGRARCPAASQASSSVYSHQRARPTRQVGTSVDQCR